MHTPNHASARPMPCSQAARTPRRERLSALPQHAALPCGPTIRCTDWDHASHLARTWREDPGPAWQGLTIFQATSAVYAACAAEIRAYVAYHRAWREWWTTGWRHGIPPDSLVRALADSQAALADALCEVETALYWLDYARTQEGPRRPDEARAQMARLDQETEEQYGRLLFLAEQVSREYAHYSQQITEVS
jgi:hypothetical protein